MISLHVTHYHVTNTTIRLSITNWGEGYREQILITTSTRWTSYRFASLKFSYHDLHIPNLEEVIISEVYKEDFGKIQDEFVKLFLDVTNILMKDARVTLEDLKKLLTSYPELEIPLLDADTIRKVMRVVQRHCSFITCNYLYAVADYFNITEIREKINAFEQLVEEFCKHTLRHHSYVDSLLAKHLLSSETITFKLEWSPHDKTLNDIQGLLRKTFENLASHIESLASQVFVVRS